MTWNDLCVAASAHFEAGRMVARIHTRGEPGHFEWRDFGVWIERDDKDAVMTDDGVWYDVKGNRL